jgi:hypothetical protein
MRLEAGFTLLVFFALRAILEPSLARVCLSFARFFTLGAAQHWLALLTILPFLGPEVQRNFRVTFLPDRAHTIFSVVV